MIKCVRCYGKPFYRCEICRQTQELSNRYIAYRAIDKIMCEECAVSYTKKEQVPIYRTCEICLKTTYKTIELKDYYV